MTGTEPFDWVAVDWSGEFRVGYDKNGPGLTDKYWNLRTDDLTQQSDECVAFLAGLLGESASA
jgi:hypothetical protein